MYTFLAPRFLLSADDRNTGHILPILSPTSNKFSQKDCILNLKLNRSTTDLIRRLDVFTVMDQQGMDVLYRHMIAWTELATKVRAPVWRLS